jgi:glycosyltransferase involved in cell wall biosynthesis
LTLRCVALLGRRDEPTDAVEEYCRYLANALQSHDIQLEIARVPWEKHGWSQALHDLRAQAPQWRGTWVLLQYTALAWSPRGFPHKFLGVLRILKSSGARVAIVFHDVEPYSGDRLIDSFRRFLQLHTMRRALALADLAVFAVRPENLSWPPKSLPPQAHFIPVGANLPIPLTASAPQVSDPRKSVAVFGITGGDGGARETQLILSALCHAAKTLGPLHLSVFGRHAELREAALTEGLRNVPVTLTVEGVLDPAEVVRRLSACTVLLFVRGTVCSRRGSAIAGISCGLPVIGFSGSETAAPITDAGVVLVPPEHPDQLNDALVRVLSNPELRAELARRSQDAHRDHFSWESISARFATLLRQ